MKKISLLLIGSILFTSNFSSLSAAEVNYTEIMRPVLSIAEKNGSFSPNQLFLLHGFSPNERTSTYRWDQWNIDGVCKNPRKVGEDEGFTVEASAIYKHFYEAYLNQWELVAKKERALTKEEEKYLVDARAQLTDRKANYYEQADYYQGGKWHNTPTVIKTGEWFQVNGWEPCNAITNELTYKNIGEWISSKYSDFLSYNLKLEKTLLEEYANSKITAPGVFESKILSGSVLVMSAKQKTKENPSKYVAVILDNINRNSKGIEKVILLPFEPLNNPEPVYVSFSPIGAGYYGKYLQDLRLTNGGWRQSIVDFVKSFTKEEQTQYAPEKQWFFDIGPSMTMKQRETVFRLGIKDMLESSHISPGTVSLAKIGGKYYLGAMLTSDLIKK